jgi:hypothetical protein
MISILLSGIAVGVFGGAVASDAVPVADTITEHTEMPITDALKDGYEIRAAIGATILMQKGRAAIACGPSVKEGIAGYRCVDIAPDTASK